MRYTLSPTPIEGVLVLTRLTSQDQRGYFERLFCPKSLKGVGEFNILEQVNHSMTSIAGTVRGLHCQRGEYAETKIITCLQGAVFDVAVDARPHSKTWGQHYQFTLKAEDHTSLIIPKGCLHGFQALTDKAELIYCHDASYHPAAEDGVYPLDPTLNIRWPLPPLHLSERDLQLPKWRLS